MKGSDIKFTSSSMKLYNIGGADVRLIRPNHPTSAAINIMVQFGTFELHQKLSYLRGATDDSTADSWSFADLQIRGSSSAFDARMVRSEYNV
eukprot:6183461-Pleurochrysis_carterae.AAC.2